MLSEFNSAIAKDSNFEGVYNLTFDLAIELIVVGIIGVIITSFAIAATYRENIFVLKIYAIMLIFVTVFSLVTGVTFLIFSGKITTTITDKIESTYITNYYEDETFRLVYDTLQRNYQCCGINNYKDWDSNPYFNCSSATSTSAVKCLVPSSCCRDSTETTNYFCSGNVLADEEKLTNIYENGCSDIIINYASYGISVTAGCSIAFCIFLIINIGLVNWLIMLIQKEKALYNAINYTELDDAF